MSTPAHLNIDIVTLNAPGKASASERKGAVTVTGNSPLMALQVVAAQGGIRIHLAQHEIDDLLAAGTFKITANFSLQDSSSATQAAQQIVNMANAVLQAKRDVPHGRTGRNIGWALFLIVLAIIAFLLAIRLLDMIYGTHQLEGLLAGI